MFRVFWLTVTTFAVAVSQTAFAQTSARSAEIFQKADLNGDAALNYDEFVVFIDLSAEAKIGNAGRVKAMGLYQRGFKRVDANNDKLVTPAELRAMAGT